MGRAPCCDKANVKKGPWSPEEDAKLKAYIEQNGTGGNWISLPQKIGLKRCGKSCRLRWLNYLRPNIRHGGFSEEEDNIICSLYASIGSRWSIIAAQLPGRTDNDIKNYWNTRLKKKLQGKQRKEQQAKPRRVGSLKQETKRETENLNVASEGVSNQVSFWTMVYNTAVAMPATNVPNQDLSYDSTSLRSLLLKLGGGFSEDDHKRSYNITVATTPNLQYNSCDVNSSRKHQVCENTMNRVNSAAVFHTTKEVHSESPCEFHGANDDFPKDLSYLTFTNPEEREESLMEDCCAMEAFDMVNTGRSTGTCSTENGSWGDMSSCVYSPLVSDNEAFRQGMHQDFALEESGYLGQR